MKKTLLIIKNSGRLLNLPYLTRLNQIKKITVEDVKFFNIKVAKELNSFFSKVVKNLKIPEYSETHL